MTNHTPEDRKRMERKRRTHLVHRLVIAALVLGVLLLLAGGGYALWRLRQERADRPPATLVIIAESEIEDGTKIAGAIARVESDGRDLKTQAIDPLMSAEIPGTSYDRLRDALALGGPDLVARLVVEDAEPEAVGWLLLDERAWAQLIDEAGGASVELTGSTTVFTGDKLFRFSAGTRTLTGKEAVALLRGAETLSAADSGFAVREQLTRQIAEAAARDARATGSLVEAGKAESSEEPEALSGFFGPGAKR